MYNGMLGRLEPSDYNHVVSYPLRAIPRADRPKHVPVVIGVNWYTAFDEPAPMDGALWIGQGPLGSIRGGHCVCLEPAPDPTQPGKEQDKGAWWRFYDQGAEGACVGFGSARMMTLLNRERYDARWLYHEAQKRDGIAGPHEGTYVDAACQVLRDVGISQVVKGTSRPATRHDGIAAYRWATHTQDVLDALGDPSAQWVTILNSWGEQYPQRVRLPVHVLDRLLIGEGGEAMVVTDR